MPSPLNIPKVYTTADALRLKEELERMAQEVDSYLRGLTNTTQPVPTLSLVNPSSLSFGHVARVNVPDGYTLSMQLPRPDPKRIGQRCGIVRMSITGECLVYAVDCLVGGHERFRVMNDMHCVEFLFDGNYYPTYPGAGF